MPADARPTASGLPDASPVLAKVRKLLAKAEDRAATPEEAELYTAKAAELIADYGIDAALLAAELPGSDVVGDREVALDAPYSKDKAELLCEVALRLRCQPVLRTRRDPGSPTEHTVHLFGHASDLTRTELLFTSLLMQSASRLATTPVPDWEHKAAFRRSWMAGFRMSVSRRLAEAEDRASHDARSRATSAGRGTGLVLADRSREVATALREAYPDARAGRTRRLSGSGMQDGYVAGQAADLGGQRLPGARPALGR